ncbi:hypothetical protein [Actinopolymorpha alba]|uniref:hypothetical protein n=1 Tax=Actinopolymorpha alba TaxID=533267 RepID=UPI00036DAC23|nr:hypothetical protein [Actinopolymorpha alba]
MSRRSTDTTRGTYAGTRAGYARKRLVVLVAVALLGLVTAGCGGSSSPNAAGTATRTGHPTATHDPSGTATPSAAVCAKARELKKSLTALRNINIAAVGAEGVRRAISKVTSDLSALKTVAAAEWKTQIAELSSALSALGTAIGHAEGTATSSPTVEGIAAAAQRVATAAHSLVTTLSAHCPGM